MVRYSFSTTQLAKDIKECWEMDTTTILAGVFIGITFLEDNLITFMKSLLKSIQAFDPVILLLGKNGTTLQNYIYEVSNQNIVYNSAKLEKFINEEFGV